MSANKATTIVRTESSDPDFPLLVALLNLELRERYGDARVIYDKFNQISDLETVVIAYVNDVPSGCACFKEIDEDTVEIKRMFVKPAERNMGLASGILNELEVWAKEDGFSIIVLETPNKQYEAIDFYKKRGYKIIPNYGPYVGMELSVCMRKKL